MLATLQPVRRAWIFAIAAFLMLVALGLFPRTSRADSLHGYCAGAGQCIDNGTNSPTTTNGPSNFGFTVLSGPASGQLAIDLLAPNNQPADPTYRLTGTLSGTADLFSATPWTSGDLDVYLNFKGGASPANPIGAYLPSTVALDPGATGFFVYQVELSGMLQGISNPNVSPLLNINQGVPLASYLVGFLNEGTVGSPIWVATANSGAIFQQSPPSVVPEPGSLALITSGLVGLVGLVRRRFRVG